MVMSQVAEELHLKSKETSHLFVNRRGIWVDEGIADLLEAVWDYGLRTKFSCEGGEELKRTLKDGTTTVISTTESYVMFNTVDDAVTFMRTTRKHLGFGDYYIHPMRFRLGLAPRGAGVDFGKDVLLATTKLWQGLVK